MATGAVIAELATQLGEPHITGTTRIPWAARPPTTLSAADQCQLPEEGSMCDQFIVQRTVLAPLFFSISTSPLVMSLNS